MKCMGIIIGEDTQQGPMVRLDIERNIYNY